MKIFTNTKFLIICILPIVCSQSGDEVLVNLKNGQIKGKVEITPKHETMFYSFKQIPYAAPPLAELRFQPPHPVENWSGVLDTTKDNTKVCYQMFDDFYMETEDCLYLNVYTPRLQIENGCKPNLPVMFFIHGGGFVGGSGVHALFGPEFLLDYEVVIVTINYRLGPFGFLYTGDNAMIGNNGLRDQQYALLWAKENIESFGGDPNKITLFGQSAGGASVGYQMLNDKSNGLFRAAILESGSPISPWAFQRDPRKYAFKTAGYIDSSFNGKDNTTELLEFLLKASASDIDKASFAVSEEEYVNDAQIVQGYYYAPVLEQDEGNAFITEKMFESIANGKANRIPMIIGINSQEGISPTTETKFLTGMMRIYDQTPAWIVPNDMNVPENQLRTDAGKEIRNIYCKPGTNFADDLVGSIEYLSDTSFARPVIKHAAMQSFYSTVYTYQFSYDGMMGNLSVDIPGVEGVGHSEENGYLWRSSTGRFVNTDLSIFPELDLIVQDRLLELWTNFAKYLNPTPLEKESPALKNVNWTPVFAGGILEFPYLDINHNLTMQNRPKYRSLEAWDAVYRKYGTRPYDTY